MMYITVDDAITSLADLLLELNLAEIDIQPRLEDTVLDWSFGGHLQSSYIKLR